MKINVREAPHGDLYYHVSQGLIKDLQRCKYSGNRLNPVSISGWQPLANDQLDCHLSTDHACTG